MPAPIVFIAFCIQGNFKLEATAFLLHFKTQSNEANLNDTGMKIGISYKNDGVHLHLIKHIISVKLIKNFKNHIKILYRTLIEILLLQITNNY